MRSGDPLDNYYNLNLTELNRICPLTAEFLPCAIRYGPYQAAISLAGPKTIVFTPTTPHPLGPRGRAQTMST
jgi:hypothetical protein